MRKAFEAIRSIILLLTFAGIAIYSFLKFNFLLE